MRFFFRRAAQDLAPVHPAEVGDYALGPMLGRGPFGVVYASQAAGEALAVRVLYPGHERDPRGVAHFLETARRASELGHPHIVGLSALGTLPSGLGYQVMPRLSGMTLSRFLARHGPLAPGPACALLARVASALDALHAEGLVHGALRPASIFLAYDADDVTPWLIDVGVSALIAESGVRTLAGMPLGRPFYVSPEQVRELGASAQSDVYALGAIAGELLTGEPPVAAGSSIATRMAHLDMPPRPASSLKPGLPPAVDEVLAALLAKDPDARPRSASEGVSALAEALSAPLGAKLQLPRPAARPTESSAQPADDPEPRVFTLPTAKYVPAPRRRGPKIPWTLVGLLIMSVLTVYLLARARVAVPTQPPPARDKLAP